MSEMVDVSEALDESIGRLSNLEVAREIGVAPGTLSRLHRRTAPTMGQATRRKIAVFLKIDERRLAYKPASSSGHVAPSAGTRTLAISAPNPERDLLVDALGQLPAYGLNVEPLSVARLGNGDCLLTCLPFRPIRHAHPTQDNKTLAALVGHGVGRKLGIASLLIVDKNEAGRLRIDSVEFAPLLISAPRHEVIEFSEIARFEQLFTKYIYPWILEAFGTQEEDLSDSSEKSQTVA